MSANKIIMNVLQKCLKFPASVKWWNSTWLVHLIQQQTCYSVVSEVSCPQNFQLPYVIVEIYRDLFWTFETVPAHSGFFQILDSLATCAPSTAFYSYPASVDAQPLQFRGRFSDSPVIPSSHAGAVSTRRGSAQHLRARAGPLLQGSHDGLV